MVRSSSCRQKKRRANPAEALVSALLGCDRTGPWKSHSVQATTRASLPVVGRGAFSFVRGSSLTIPAAWRSSPPVSFLLLASFPTPHCIVMIEKQNLDLVLVLGHNKLGFELLNCLLLEWIRSVKTQICTKMYEITIDKTTGFSYNMPVAHVTVRKIGKWK